LIQGQLIFSLIQLVVFQIAVWIMRVLIQNRAVLITLKVRLRVTVENTFNVKFVSLKTENMHSKDMLQIGDLIIPEQDIGEIVAVDGDKRIFTVRKH